MNTSDKYYRKNEFRIHTNPKYRTKDNKNHVVYVTVKRGNMYRVNAITHSKQFKNKRTKPLAENPHKSDFSNRKSRISIPFWESERYLKNKVRDNWRFSNRERKSIKKFNRTYLQKKNPTRK